MKPMNIQGPIATDDEPPSKKCKTNGAGKRTKHDEPTIDNLNDEPLDESQKFMVHLQVYQTVAEKKPGRGGKSSLATSFVSKGPFSFNTQFSFTKFKMQVSSALSCDISKLLVSRFEWKFEGQSQSTPRKKIANEAGFEALLDAIKAKCTTEHVVVLLYMPRPPKEDDVRDFDAYMWHRIHSMKI